MKPTPKNRSRAVSNENTALHPARHNVSTGLARSRAQKISVFKVLPVKSTMLVFPVHIRGKSAVKHEIHRPYGYHFHQLISDHRMVSTRFYHPKYRASEQRYGCADSGRNETPAWPAFITAAAATASGQCMRPINCKRNSSVANGSTQRTHPPARALRRLRAGASRDA